MGVYHVMNHDEVMIYYMNSSALFMSSLFLLAFCFVSHQAQRTQAPLTCAPLPSKREHLHQYLPSPLNFSLIDITTTPPKKPKKKQNTTTASQLVVMARHSRDEYRNCAVRGCGAKHGWKNIDGLKVYSDFCPEHSCRARPPFVELTCHNSKDEARRYCLYREYPPQSHTSGP
jgi:hypothetical protein